MSEYIVANWKMNGSKTQCDRFFDELSKYNSNRKIVLCPPYHLLDYSSHHANRSAVSIGAQDCSALDGCGARTGDISASMLKSIGCEYIILGHSERRSLYNEKNESIGSKVCSALSNSLKVILCVGELRYEQNLTSFMEEVSSQLDIISPIPHSGNIIIAYEPVWAIGTNHIPSLSRIKDSHQYILDTCEQRFAIKPEILYGGSVNIQNSKDILSLDYVSGVLIGSASLNPDEFLKICYS